VYADHGVTVDITPYLALSAQSDLAPGSGGSRITPCGPVTVGALVGRGAFVALYPSSQLVAHVDPPIAGRRFHVPLVVNDGCWVFSDGHWQQLAVGRVYQMDPTIVHGAVNWGTERRLHLMVDTED
jgi:hypothetical protein